MSKKTESLACGDRDGAQHWNWRRALPGVSSLVSLTAITTVVAAVDTTENGPTASTSTGRAYLDTEGAEFLLLKPMAKVADNAVFSVNVFELRWCHAMGCWSRTFIGQLTDCTACATQVAQAIHGETLGATEVMRWCDAVTPQDATPGAGIKTGGNTSAEFPVVVKIPLNGARLVELEIAQNANVLWSCL